MRNRAAFVVTQGASKCRFRCLHQIKMGGGLLAPRCFPLVLQHKQPLCSCPLLLWETVQKLLIDF